MDLNYLDEIKIERHPKPQKNAGAETVPAVKPLVSAGKKTRQELIESLREKSREEEKAEFVSPQDIARLKKHLAENSQKGAVVQKTETLKAVKAAETPAPAVSVKAPATPVPEEKAVKAIKQPKAVKKAQPAKKAKPIKPVKKHNAQPKAKFKKTPKIIHCQGALALFRRLLCAVLLFVFCKRNTCSRAECPAQACTCPFGFKAHTLQSACRCRSVCAVCNAAGFPYVPWTHDD